MHEIRNVTESDFDTIIGLNDAEMQQTGPMDRSRLESLVGMSTYCRVATVDEEVAAFLIALREGTPYDSENYNWFASRFERFLYVDRIVVSQAFAGRRIGSALYDELFDFARLNGVNTITCEYNLVPPNPTSRAFHNKYGFMELGTQWVAGGSKQVSLQAAESQTSA